VPISDKDHCAVAMIMAIVYRRGHKLFDFGLS